MTADMKFWDNIAPKYAKSSIRDEESYRYALGRTRSYLKPNDRVLELGCGTASTAIELAKGVESFVATDISDGMLAVGRQRAQEAGADNLTLLHRPAEDLADGEFDAVLAHNLLHLIPNLEEVLRNVAAKLPTGGLFISKTPCLGEQVGTWKYYMFKVAIPLMKLVGKAPSFVDFTRMQDLEAAVQAAGFEIIETGNYPPSTPSRYLVARKR
ncbi:methyltransferase, UbiE/COQ5 family protein [Roseobacter sp. SK209-2-6]|uniref:class I SAM-dependent methyltransferase n=1 Tax=Roseobacter sp. SK209-2-6 TaxID=388739 RepID=UPI0000F3EBC3|nr:class I SAM-dependent methyltransferase [Roseobacter sp. SK209-2-6]EBA16748.1 methyltransferase, UbiE/COQ5 family protein [Roseobacter sp. SK209-2-6]